MTERSFNRIQQDPGICNIDIWLWVLYTPLHVNDNCLNTLKWMNERNKMPYQKGQLHPKYYTTTERKCFRSRQLANQTRSGVSASWNIWALPGESLVFWALCIFTLLYNLRAFFQNVWCYKSLFTPFNAAHCSRKCIRWGLVSAIYCSWKYICVRFTFRKPFKRMF